MKSTPLRIAIPKPCGEDWEAMEEKGNDRFCQNCRKMVVDFSNLTDTELYHYLRSVKEVPCGRFHNSQLNKNIVPEQRKSFAWKNIYKAAAAVFAFLSMKHSEATGFQNKPGITMQPSEPKYEIVPADINLIISGIVRNNQDTALENAEIRIGETVMAYTGKDGKFSFEIPDHLTNQAFLLSVHYKGLVSSIRNYHPVMQSADYTITLYPPYCEPCFTMGIMIAPEFPTTTISFNKTSTILDPAIRNILAEVATTLRNQPEITVQVIAYPQTSKDKLIAQKRQSAIIKYLTDQEGISETRLSPAIQPYSVEKANTIDISGQ